MVKHEIKKITHYEYWPFWIFYAPIAPYLLWNSLKTKSLTYYTAANPCMKFGGLFSYSKFDIQDKIEAKYRPKHFFLKTENRENTSLPLTFPFIAKPDIGERGKSVQLINNQNEWSTYLNNNSNDIILQEYIDLSFEFGVFYVRFPNEEKGKILSITGKRFLTFKGDGKTSLREFIESDARAYFNKSYLYMKFHEEQELVLKDGESMLLEEIGNHNRGTYFYDDSDIISEKLEKTLDEIVQPIPGFYYGRLDVKAESIATLQNGEFQILEINGVNSEPTHIYDKNTHILDAYREVFRHLKVQYQIVRQNMQNGHRPAKLSVFVKELYRYLTA